MRNETEAHVKEPFIRMTKRATMPLWKSWLIRIVAVVAALAVSGLLAFILIDKLKANPGRIGDFYNCFINGVFDSTTMVWKFFKGTAILLCISLAVTPAFRMRFWNIGAEGQTLMGVLGATSVAFYLGGKMPEWALLIVMLVAALFYGAIWGIVPAVFKTLSNTNETLFTLMMNYVATFLVSYFLLKWVPSGNALGELPFGHLSNSNKSEDSYIIIIVAVAILTVVLYFYLNYSKHGYEISVVGGSENTARYIGINVKKVIIRTMLLSGILCGFAGFLIGSGLNHSITTDAVGGQGFTAIMVSWLAKFNPIFMLITSGLVIFLQMGAEKISEVFDVQGAMPEIIVGVILLFIIGCEFFINYQLHFRKKNTAGGENK